jgi:Mn-dependent DtxR family transcriptional regulator
MRAVEVHWRDCHALTEGWTHLSDLDTHERVIRSVGFVLEDRKHDHLVLAQSLDDGLVDNVIAIPLAVIISVCSLSPVD